MSAGSVTDLGRRRGRALSRVVARQKEFDVMAENTEAGAVASMAPQDAGQWYAETLSAVSAACECDFKTAGAIVARLSHQGFMLESIKSPWRPIATAPKNGESVLLYYPEQGTHFGGVIEGWWFSSPKQIDDGWETFIGTIGEPTLWMPIPPPADHRGSVRR